MYLLQLKETKEFEERRAIRAAIRKLRDSNNNTANGRTTLSKNLGKPVLKICAIKNYYVRPSAI